MDNGKWTKDGCCFEPAVTLLELEQPMRAKNTREGSNSEEVSEPSECCARR